MLNFVEHSLKVFCSYSSLAMKSVLIIFLTNNRNLFYEQ